VEPPAGSRSRAPGGTWEVGGLKLKGFVHFYTKIANVMDLNEKLLRCQRQTASRSHDSP